MTSFWQTFEKKLGQFLFIIWSHWLHHNFRICSIFFLHSFHILLFFLFCIHHIYRIFINKDFYVSSHSTCNHSLLLLLRRSECFPKILYIQVFIFLLLAFSLFSYFLLFKLFTYIYITRYNKQ